MVPIIAEVEQSPTDMTDAFNFTELRLLRGLSRRTGLPRLQHYPPGHRTKSEPPRAAHLGDVGDPSVTQGKWVRSLQWTTVPNVLTCVDMVDGYEANHRINRGITLGLNRERFTL